MKSEQVVFSIVLFSLIYVLLGFVWIMVLNGKIQKGPDPLDSEEDGEPPGFVGAASERAGGSGSMTDREG